MSRQTSIKLANGRTIRTGTRRRYVLVNLNDPGPGNGVYQRSDSLQVITAAKRKNDHRGVMAVYDTITGERVSA